MIHIVYGENCPYCSMAKQLLKNEGIEYVGIDVTHDQEKRMEYARMSGMMTIPQIFSAEPSSENVIGGYTELQQLHSDNKLQELLKNS
ncbi:glutaredoxin [Candidatus Gracilibacteria bacterium]|nr:glutaredoxin [Candidatus Gracilibacteria bacterium]